MQHRISLSIIKALVGSGVICSLFLCTLGVTQAASKPVSAPREAALQKSKKTSEVRKPARFPVTTQGVVVAVSKKSITISTEGATPSKKKKVLINKKTTKEKEPLSSTVVSITQDTKVKGKTVNSVAGIKPGMVIRVVGIKEGDTLIIARTINVTDKEKTTSKVTR